MLGPEQINSPAHMTTLAASDASHLRVNHEVGRSLGLMNHQIIKGLIEAQGQNIGLRFQGQFIELPKQWQSRIGQAASFQVVATQQGFNLVPQTAVPALPALSSEILRLWYKPSATPQMLPNLLESPAINTALAQAGLQSLASSLMLSSRNITAQTLSSAFINSGFFGEARLKRGQVSYDLKTALRMLLQDSAISSDRDTILGAIDEIEHRQIETIQAQQRQDSLWHFSVLVDKHPVDIVLQRETSQIDSTGKTPPWTVDISTDLGSWGKVWLNSKLYADEKIELIAWIPNAQIAATAQAQIHELELALSEFDMALSRFQIVAEPRPSSDPVFTERGQVLDLST